MILALINKANTLIRLKKFEFANKCFEYISKVQPENLTVLIGKGIIAFETKQIEDAFKFFQLAFEIEESYEVLYNLGVCYLSIKQYYDALEYFKKAKK